MIYISFCLAGISDASGVSESLINAGRKRDDSSISNENARNEEGKRERERKGE